MRITGRADPLREAALRGQLGLWTRHLTGVVVATCRKLGWEAVAQGYSAEGLSVSKQECLSLDVMVFPRTDRLIWKRPIAAFELENLASLEFISYSVWKVSVIRCSLGGVFCYCQQQERIADLLVNLTRGVMAGIYPSAEAYRQEILLVIGTRSRAEDVPDGFFKPYLWDDMYRKFRALW